MKQVDTKIPKLKKCATFWGVGMCLLREAGNIVL